MGKVYKQALKFKDKYPGTIAWRLKQNSEIVEIKRLECFLLENQMA